MSNEYKPSEFLGILVAPLVLAAPFILATLMVWPFM